MKFDSVCAVCLLLLWTLKDVKAAGEISVSTIAGGIRLKCEGENDYISVEGGYAKTRDVLYEDSNSREYKCNDSTILVKFRTCDTCVEVSASSIAYVVVGELVAMIALGIAVYLIASQSGPVTSQKTKSSDRQPIVQNDARVRDTNDAYQRLRFHGGGKRDEYDVINQRR